MRHSKGWTRYCRPVLVGVAFLIGAPVYAQTSPLTVKFSTVSYSAPQTAGVITVTVLLTGVPTGDVSVNYQVAASPPAPASTAIPDVDYASATAAGSVTFVYALNETVKTFDVVIYNNLSPSQTGRFGWSLSRTPQPPQRGAPCLECQP